MAKASVRNNFARRVLIFLAVIVLAGLLFALVGCNDGTDTETSDASSEATSSETTSSETTENTESGDTDTPADEGGEAKIFVDGKFNYQIVINDSASSALSSSGNKLKNAFNDALGVSVNMRKEGIFETINGGTMDGPKIVVGKLKKDPTSQQIERDLYDSEYVIKVVDSVLYIIGGTDAATDKAVEKFIELYVKSGMTELIIEEKLIADHKIDPEFKNLTINGNSILDYVIVYYDSYYAKQCAKEVQSAIATKLDLTLPIVSHNESETELEILVGKTNRDAAKAFRKAYDRPNVYYDVEVVGDKLIVMGEGYRTLTKVGNLFETFMLGLKADEQALKGNLITGDVLGDVDAVDTMTGALNQSADTDLRVLHWNMAAPLSWDQADTKWSANWPFAANATGRQQRAEQQADMVLIYNPDIFTTNEVYNYHAGGVQYQTLFKELSEYFTIVDSSYDTRDDDMPDGVPSAPEKPTSENPEKIFIRKGKFNVVDSGWRYLSDGTNFHGIHWAALETVSDGTRFIASVGHYGDARREVTYGSEHLSAISFAQRASGFGVCPIILTGDMFTYVNHSNGSKGATYYYLQQKGYSDSQTTATVNCNDDRGTLHGTFHDPMNDSNKKRASEDFVWYNNKLSALKFGVITVPESTNTSDHWPVFADLKFVD